MNNLRRVQFGAIIAVAVGILLSAIGADYPPNTWLQVGPIALLVFAAPFVLRRFPISNASVFSVTAFVLLHLLAARWTYSNVPYVDWGQVLMDVDIDRAFGFERNMFDRLVHFAFGLLLTLPIVEWMRRRFDATVALALSQAILVLLAASAFYEIFEWLLAVGMDAESAAAYNGQQGDIFDAPKDMAVAFLGSLIASAIIWRRAWN